jgi:hypothetical protein
MAGCSQRSNSKGANSDGPFSGQQTRAGTFTGSYSYVVKVGGAIQTAISCKSDVSKMNLNERYFDLEIVPSQCVDPNDKLVDGHSLGATRYLGVPVREGVLYFPSGPTNNEEVVGKVISTGVDFQAPDEGGINRIRFRYLNKDAFFVEDSTTIGNKVETLKGNFFRRAE